MSAADRLDVPIRPSGKVEVIASGASVSEVGRRMCEARVGSLLVTDSEGRVIGIVTERDIVRRMVAEGGSPDATTAGEIMTGDVVCCQVGAPMSEAQKIMIANRARYVPVFDGDAPVGVVSSLDLVAQQLLDDRAMRQAAEQVALLSTDLRCLDFAELADLIVREVPSILGGTRSVLCFPKEAQDRSLCLSICRQGCHCPDRHLESVQRALAEEDVEADLVREDIPDVCRPLGGRAPCVFMPLEAATFSSGPVAESRPMRGYLCMCGLDPSVACSRRLNWYKAALVREVLNAHLGNAKLYQDARRSITTDALTGVATRAMFEEKLDSECSLALRHRRRLAVAILDVDRFKEINDQLGHAFGDDALKKVCESMRKQKRREDLLARYGGDEFLLMLPETSTEEAQPLLDRIRREVEQLPVPKGLQLTLSCGVAEFSWQEPKAANELLRCADIALYEAKNAGRNCVITWQQIANRMKSGEAMESSRVRELQSRIAGLSIESEEMFVQSVWGLVQAIEAHDPYTKRHSEDVMRYAVNLAEMMGVDADYLEVIRRAAMVHDIGKIGVPETILRKPGRLQADERRVMEQHPVIAARILQQMRFLEQELPIVRHHHERWDGGGYPDGLAGEEIPLGARIIAVADTFDAITSDRAHRHSRTVADAIRALESEAGKQFEAAIVAAMLQWLEQRRLELGKDDLAVEDLLVSSEACGSLV